MADSIKSVDVPGVHGLVALNADGTAIGAPVGGATATNQDTLNALIKTLQELSQRLAPLAGAMANTAALRVAPISSVSTAVTGPLTSAQSIAEKATGGINYTNRIAAINLNAVQSNINNCVGA